MWSLGKKPGVTVMAAVVVVAALFLLTATLVQAQRLQSPTRLTQMTSGQLLITDLKLQKLLVWDSRRKSTVRVLKVPGRPVSVAFGWNKLFVGNEITQTVDVLNMGGRLQYTLGGEGYHVSRPSDIAVDTKKGLVFVSNSASGEVLVFDKGGAFLNSLPAPGQQPLYQPTGLVVDPVRGEVLVSDFGKRGWFSSTAMVRTYDYNGNYQGGISGKRTDGYGFSRPQGLALNAQGLLFVVDSLRGQVLVFNRGSKQGMAIIGQLGKRPGQLWLPLDVHIDKKTNDLYVTNNRNGRLEVFKGRGVLP